MANPISKNPSTNSILGYVEYAKTVLSKGGKHSFVNKSSSVLNLDVDKKLAAEVLKEANKVGNDATKGLAFLKNKQLVVAQYNNEFYSIGSLLKPAGDKIESGYLAEAILQAAITARFVKRNGNVSTADVVSFLKDYVNSKVMWNIGKESKAINKIIEYTTDNFGFSKKDIVISYMSLNDKAYTYLENNLSKVANNSQLRVFFQDSANYVNKGQPKEHSDYFYNNKRVDKLEIKSLGILGQVGKDKTKADIVTYYYEGYNPTTKTGDLKKFNLNLSVKIKGETQFGQASNIYFEAMERFASAAGVKLSKSAKEKINKIIPTQIKDGKISPIMPKEEIFSKKLNVEVYKIVYEDIVNQINNKLKTNELIDGIMEFISYNDPSLVLVDIGSGEKLYFVKKLLPVKKQIKGSVVTTEIKKQPQTGNYNMDIFVNNAHVLRLESRYTGNTFRNFVKSGKGLRAWMADI